MSYKTFDATGTTQEHDASGDGSSGAPFVVAHGNAGNLLEVTLSLDTSAYGSGDVLADTQVVSNAMRVLGGRGVLESLVIVDQDDVGAAFDIWFLDSNVSMGTENSAPSLSDANALHLLGYVPVLTTDYKDLGGAKVAFLRDLNLRLKAAASTRDLYIAVVNGAGTPTFTASGVKLRLGMRWD